MRENQYDVIQFHGTFKYQMMLMPRAPRKSANVICNQEKRILMDRQTNRHDGHLMEAQTTISMARLKLKNPPLMQHVYCTIIYITLLSDSNKAVLL